MWELKIFNKYIYRLQASKQVRNIFQSLYENVCFFPVQWSVHARSPDSVARGYQSMQSRWKSEYIISNYVSIFLSARVHKGGDKKERREGEKN